MKSVYIYKGPMSEHIVTMADADAATAIADDWGQDVSTRGPQTVWKPAVLNGNIPDSYKTWYIAATGMTIENSPPGTFPMFPAESVPPGFYVVTSVVKGAQAIINMSAADAANFRNGTNKILIQGAVDPITAVNGTHNITNISGGAITLSDVNLSGVAGTGPWTSPSLCAKPN